MTLSRLYSKVRSQIKIHSHQMKNVPVSAIDAHYEVLYFMNARYDVTYFLVFFSSSLCWSGQCHHEFGLSSLCCKLRTIFMVWKEHVFHHFLDIFLSYLKIWTVVIYCVAYCWHKWVVLHLLDFQLDGELYFAPSFPTPPNTDFKGYQSYIDSFLPQESPHLYGLHPNAEIDFLTTTSDNLFRTVLEMQPRDSGTGSGLGISREDKVWPKTLCQL